MNRLIDTKIRIMGLLCCLLVLPVHGACAGSGGENPWIDKARETLAGMMGEVGAAKNASGLLVLTNAGYGQVAGDTTETFLDIARETTGCSTGKRSLLPVHKSIDDPLWFSLYARDSKKIAYAVWQDDAFGRQVIDADPARLFLPENWQTAANGLVKPNMFSVVSLSLTWDVDPPWPLLLAATFHDHFCPGVNAGYYFGRYVQNHLPLRAGEKYVFVNAPDGDFRQSFRIPNQGGPPMTAEDTMNSEDFKKCEAFHGHVYPGLSIGYQAAKTAMARLQETRAEDEEVVAIVETDACSADAVQVLTGCTFGKGNFIYRDHGKMALTLLSRNTGRGVRVALKPEAFRPDGEHMALLQKVMAGEATDAERERFRTIHLERSRRILETPVEALFHITAVETRLPPRARIEPSEPCALCGEPTMPSKMEIADGRKVCRGCL